MKKIQSKVVAMVMTGAIVCGTMGAVPVMAATRPYCNGTGVCQQNGTRVCDGSGKKLHKRDGSCATTKNSVTRKGCTNASKGKRNCGR